VGNNTNGSSPGASTALKVFKEYWANPSYGTTATPGVFTRHRFGDAEFILLDDRFNRAAPTASAGSILGTDQTAWLISTLKASTATFKFVACGSLFGPGATESWYTERPAALAALHAAIKANKVQGVVFLSGDIHKSLFQSHLKATTGGYDIPELVSSPLANAQTGQTCTSGASGYSRRACEKDGNYVTEVDVDTTLADPQFTATLLDVNGAVRSTWTVKRSQLEVP
jgi:alkaline phosphatase D